MRHSSAAERWLCWRVDRVSSFCLIVASNCLIYSVRRSRKAACACRLRCFRSSDVAYIYEILVNQDIYLRESVMHTGFLPPLRFWGCAGSCDGSGSASCSSDDSIELGVPSRGGGSTLLSAAMSSSAVSLSPICRNPANSTTGRQLEC